MEGVEALETVRALLDLVAMGREDDPQDLPVVIIVVDDEDSHPGPSKEVARHAFPTGSAKRAGATHGYFIEFEDI